MSIRSVIESNMIPMNKNRIADYVEVLLQTLKQLSEIASLVKEEFTDSGQSLEDVNTKDKISNISVGNLELIHKILTAIELYNSLNALNSPILLKEFENYLYLLRVSDILLSKLGTRNLNKEEELLKKETILTTMFKDKMLNFNLEVKHKGSELIDQFLLSPTKSPKKTKVESPVQILESNLNSESKKMKKFSSAFSPESKESIKMTPYFKTLDFHREIELQETKSNKGAQNNTRESQGNLSVEKKKFKFEFKPTVSKTKIILPIQKSFKISRTKSYDSSPSSQKKCDVRSRSFNKRHPNNNKSSSPLRSKTVESLNKSQEDRGLTRNFTKQTYQVTGSSGILKTYSFRRIMRKEKSDIFDLIYKKKKPYDAHKLFEEPPKIPLKKSFENREEEKERIKQRMEQLKEEAQKLKEEKEALRELEDGYKSPSEHVIKKVFKTTNLFKNKTVSKARNIFESMNMVFPIARDYDKDLKDMIFTLKENKKKIKYPKYYLVYGKGHNHSDDDDQNLTENGAKNPQQQKVNSKKKNGDPIQGNEPKEMEINDNNVIYTERNKPKQEKSKMTNTQSAENIQTKAVNIRTTKITKNKSTTFTKESSLPVKTEIAQKQSNYDKFFKNEKLKEVMEKQKKEMKELKKGENEKNLGKLKNEDKEVEKIDSRKQLMLIHSNELESKVEKEGTKDKKEMTRNKSSTESKNGKLAFEMDKKNNAFKKQKPTNNKSDVTTEKIQIITDETTQSEKKGDVFNFGGKKTNNQQPKQLPKEFASNDVLENSKVKVGNKKFKFEIGSSKDLKHKKSEDTAAKPKKEKEEIEKSDTKAYQKQLAKEVIDGEKEKKIKRINNDTIQKLEKKFDFSSKTSENSNLGKVNIEQKAANIDGEKLKIKNDDLSKKNSGKIDIGKIEIEKLNNEEDQENLEDGEYNWDTEENLKKSKKNPTDGIKANTVRKYSGTDTATNKKKVFVVSEKPHKYSKVIESDEEMNFDNDEFLLSSNIGYEEKEVIEKEVDKKQNNVSTNKESLDSNIISKEEGKSRHMQLKGTSEVSKKGDNIDMNDSFKSEFDDEDHSSGNNEIIEKRKDNDPAIKTSVEINAEDQQHPKDSKVSRISIMNKIIEKINENEENIEEKPVDYEEEISEEEYEGETEEEEEEDEDINSAYFASSQDVARSIINSPLESKNKDPAFDTNQIINLNSKKSNNSIRGNTDNAFNIMDEAISNSLNKNVSVIEDIEYNSKIKKGKKKRKSILNGTENDTERSISIKDNESKGNKKNKKSNAAIDGEELEIKSSIFKKDSLAVEEQNEGNKAHEENKQRTQSVVSFTNENDDEENIMRASDSPYPRMKEKSKKSILKAVNKFSLKDES